MTDYKVMASSMGYSGLYVWSIEGYMRYGGLCGIRVLKGKERWDRRYSGPGKGRSHSTSLVRGRSQSNTCATDKHGTLYSAQASPAPALVESKALVCPRGLVCALEKTRTGRMGLSS